MKPICLYAGGSTKACRIAAAALEAQGAAVVDHPSPDVTHLLLDVPSFLTSGLLKSGEPLEPLLERLPETITVIGGNLRHPALADYKTWDLLQDETYLAENAAITAQCTIKAAAPLLDTTFSQCPTLILGWGRIGKALGKLLTAIGCPVTIAARNPAHRAMLQALGYEAVDIPQAQALLPKMGLVVNTVPHPVLSCRDFSGQSLDLSSVQGLTGEGVIWARGLPGELAPRSSGNLIAETVARLEKEAAS